jgi:hypothetical protein
VVQMRLRSQTMLEAEGELCSQDVNEDRTREYHYN